MELKAQLEKEAISYKRQHMVSFLPAQCLMSKKLPALMPEELGVLMRCLQPHLLRLSPIPVYGLQIRRLSKASKCAQQLSELASARGDARTALEAQAYALWMAGTLAFERQQWQPALAKLLRAQ